MTFHYTTKAARGKLLDCQLIIFNVYFIKSKASESTISN